MEGRERAVLTAARAGAMLLALSLQPKTLWAVREEKKWILRGFCRKGQVLMKEQLEEAVRKTEKKPEESGKT